MLPQLTPLQRWCTTTLCCRSSHGEPGGRPSRGRRMQSDARSTHPAHRPCLSRLAATAAEPLKRPKYIALCATLKHEMELVRDLEATLHDISNTMTGGSRENDSVAASCAPTVSSAGAFGHAMQRTSPCLPYMLSRWPCRAPGQPPARPPHRLVFAERPAARRGRVIMQRGFTAALPHSSRHRTPAPSSRQHRCTHIARP